MKLIKEAVAKGARLRPACNIVGISLRCHQRWSRAPDTEDQRRGPHTQSPHKLTDEEEQAVVNLVNEPEHRNLTPEQVVAKVASAGCYLASERTIRRILKRKNQAAHRNRAKPATHHKPRQLEACQPGQVLTWDITYLPNSLVRGGYFFLYLFVDIWSRRIVGAEVHDTQCAELAAGLLQEICMEHGFAAKNTTLHADNGAPMKGATMLATMQSLGIAKSFSRPGVSDDNPFVESLFRHLKYAPSYPGRGFDSLDSAREWVARFVDWYNNHHLHSSIAYVTPAERHDGRDIAILAERRRVYEEAHSRNPRRWSRQTRTWKRPETVILNPDRIVEVRKASTDSAA